MLVYTARKHYHRFRHYKEGDIVIFLKKGRTEDSVDSIVPKNIIVRTKAFYTFKVGTIKQPEYALLFA